MLSGLKEFAGIFAPCLAPAVVLIALDVLVPVAPLFIVVAVAFLAVCLFGWSLWMVFADRSEAAAASLLATPAYVIRPWSLLTDTRSMWQLLRRKGRPGVRFAVEGTAAHYAAPLLIAAALWAIAAYLFWALDCLILDALAAPIAWVRTVPLTWIAEQWAPFGKWWDHMGWYGALVLLMAGTPYWIAIALVTFTVMKRRRQRLKLATEAVTLLRKWPYLAKARNAFGHGMWLNFGTDDHYLGFAQSREDARAVRAMHEAIYLAALFERQKRGQAIQNITGDIVPLHLDPEKGWLVDTIEGESGKRTHLYAYDVKLGYSYDDANNPARRARAQATTIYDADAREYAAAEASGVFRYSEDWLGQLWNYAKKDQPDEWKGTYRNDSFNGRVPLLVPILQAVEAKDPKPKTQTDKGSAEWEWPEKWAASKAAPNPQEVWLAKLAERLRFYVEQATERKMPPCVFRWSANDPERSGESMGDALGWCYPPQEKGPAFIWISSSQTERETAITLLHELIHAALPSNAAHGPEFVNAAAALGFVAPYTQGAFVGDWIDRELKAVGSMPRQKTAA